MDADARSESSADTDSTIATSPTPDPLAWMTADRRVEYDLALDALADGEARLRGARDEIAALRSEPVQPQEQLAWEAAVTAATERLSESARAYGRAMDRFGEVAWAASEDRWVPL